MKEHGLKVFSKRIRFNKRAGQGAGNCALAVGSQVLPYWPLLLRKKVANKSTLGDQVRKGGGAQGLGGCFATN